MAREIKIGGILERKEGTRLLTVQEAARYLAVSASTLYGWVWQRRIPFIKVGRAVRFDLDDLEGFIQGNRVQPRTAGFSGK